jgi:predicted metalloprotease with PDZ domain
MKHLLILFAVLTMTATAKPSVIYTLSMPQPQDHLFIVEMTIPNSSGTVLDLHMPAWRTGRYVLLDFSGGVQEFSVTDEKKNPLPFKKTDKDTWRIQKGKAASVIARYKVYANEFNMRTRELNGDHAFIDPLAVFMYVEELKNSPLELKVIPFGNWKVTTGLDAVPGTPSTFTAPNFEYFGDCPLEIGNQQDHSFFVDGKEHVISIFGEGNWNIDTLVTDFTKIIIANKELWGELPYNRYVFMIHCQPNAGGGTEHINSTIMGVRPFVFGNPGAYLGFLGLVSHEYFHTWNVKQLRPKAIAPYDFSKEAYTEELWVSEGTTSYYDDLILLRAKFWDSKKYLDNINQMVNNERNRFGNTVQPLAEASYDAWVKFWRSRQNAQNAESDYYGKGSHVSLLLDLEIRHRSKNKASLDAVMRTMYRRFPLTKGFTNADLQKVCEELAGGSFADVFRSFLYTTAPLPWDNILTYAGLQVVQKDSVVRPGTGITTQDAGDRTRITNIIPGSPAERAGLEINDEILAMNGFRVRTADITERISMMDIGDTAVFTLFRNDKIKEVTMVLEQFGAPAVIVQKVKEPTDLQKEIYQDWLRSRW